MCGRRGYPGGRGQFCGSSRRISFRSRRQSPHDGARRRPCMSRYLIDRIAATENIELMTVTKIVALSGDANDGLEKVRWRDDRSGAEAEARIRNVFLFVGA